MFTLDSDSSTLSPYTFEFSFLENFSNKEKLDWEFHSILDFDHGNFGIQSKNFIDLIAEPWLQPDSSIILRFNL